MTDRYNFLTVALERDLREDDAANLIQAIKCLRGVLVVKPNVTDPTSWTAETRAREKVRDAIWHALRDPFPLMKDAE